MLPVKFEQPKPNTILTCPDPCVAHVFKYADVVDKDDDDSGTVTCTLSCWAPSVWERVKMAFGAKLWLFVQGGGTQPPMGMSIGARTVFPSK